MADHYSSRLQHQPPAKPTADSRRTRQFDEAIYDDGLSHHAQTLAMAESAHLGGGHEEIFETYRALGGEYYEYDPARWELLRAGYPANRGW